MPPASILASPPRATAETGLPALRLTWILFSAWAVGAVWFLVRLGVSLSALRGMRRGITEVSPARADEARAIAGRLGLRRPVALHLASEESALVAPITWGVLRPVILLPTEYARESDARCCAALLHELTHVRRRDWVWLLLAQCLSALYWCVPFVWIAARRLSHETELACDDSVLSAGVSAPEYAAQILEVVRKMQTQTRCLPLSALPMARPPLAEARIRAILDSTRRRQSTSRSLVVLAALLPACCVPLLSLRAVAASETVAVRPVPMPAASAAAAPSSSEPVATPAESAPLTIRKNRSKPSVPIRRVASAGSDAPHPAMPLLRSEPPPALGNAALPDPVQNAILWGPAVNGLQAGIRLVGAKTTFAPGEPIWQKTYLRNRSKAEVTVETIGYYEEQGAPVITDVKGRQVKVIRYFGMGMMIIKSAQIGPGELALVGQVAVAFHSPESRQDRPHEVAPGLSFAAEGMPLALAGPGTYTLGQEITPLEAHGKPLKHTLRTGVCPLQIAHVPPVMTPKVDHNYVVDLATAPIAWGPEHSGLQAGLFYLDTKQAFFVGERVRVVVVLRNVSKAPIEFWHETSFAFLNAPEAVDAGGTKRPLTLAPGLEWKDIVGIKMTGVTFDMTSAPSATGPSHLRQSEIEPGRSVVGYYLTSFVVPPRWNDGKATPGQYRLLQPVRLGLSNDEALDTTLTTGSLDMALYDPDDRLATR